ncbi:hypothetical protein KM043_010002 [Ampulex compressa]|nr:hypothetical protein KM043_010002 [Ampulex compressa]
MRNPGAQMLSSLKAKQQRGLNRQNDEEKGTIIVGAVEEAPWAVKSTGGRRQSAKATGRRERSPRRLDESCGKSGDSEEMVRTREERIPKA